MLYLLESTTVFMTYCIYIFNQIPPAENSLLHNSYSFPKFLCIT